ncbi:MAG: hypothetical protein QM679_06435 [Patulibacter sp.]
MRPVRRHAATLGTSALLSLPTAAEATQLTAQPAGTFRDSIGINTHLRWDGTPYVTTSQATIRQLITDLGITRIRDVVCSESDAGCAAGNQRIADLYNAYGTGGPKVLLDAQVVPVPRDVPDRDTRDAKIRQALENVSVNPPLNNGMLDTLESTNEPDLFTPSDQNWADVAAADLQAIQAARKSITKSYGVTQLNWTSLLAPAAGRTENTPTFSSGAGWSSSLFQRANIHPYPGVGTPELAFDGACGNNDAVPAPGLPDVTPPEIVCAQQVTGRTTVEATETGYTNNLNACTPKGISTQAAATYMPRLVLENFRRGISHTYLYELLDLQPLYTSDAHGFGLVAAKYSGTTPVAGSVKPAYTALKNTLGTIGDLGSTVRLGGTLDVTVGTTAAPSVDLGQNTVRRMLLRRADGSWVLALWQPQSAGYWRNNYWACTWSFVNTPISPTTYRVTLGTAGQSFAIDRYTPNSSAAVQSSTTGRTIDVPLTGDVTLLSFR